jgi:hypothetical protein
VKIQAAAHSVSARNWWLKSEMPKHLLMGNNRRQNLGLLLRLRNQTAVLSVGKPVLSMPEENKACQVEQQEHVGDAPTISFCFTQT